VVDPVGGDCDAVPDSVAVEGNGTDGEEADGEEDVGPPRASGPAAFSLPFIWPSGCSAVWPWAVVVPKNIVAMMKMNFIALSCVNAPKLAALPDNARSVKNENEI
jgi:hypothetical protein